MKCPKCDYIGFEVSDRCRNCGYEFALVSRHADSPPLDLRTLDQADDGPLADLALTAPIPPPRRVPPGELDLDRVIGGPSVSADLPLFEAGSAEPESPPMVRAPAEPRRPLSVRRPTPDPSRFRSRSGEPTRHVTRTLDLPLPADPTLAAVETGEAAPLPRLGAALTDAALLLAIDGLVLYFTLRLCALSVSEIGSLPLVPLGAFFLLLNAGYLVTFTAASGQTMGKMAFGLRVVGRDAERVAPFAAVLRALGCLVSTLCLGAGLVPALLGGRAVHDRLARTRVVHVR